MTSISLIGLGLMGTALAESLAKAGHKVTVWNRTDRKPTPEGTTRAATAAEAVAAAPLVIVCVLDYPAVHAVLDDLDLNGKVLVNLTSGRPAEARESAEWAVGRGAEYLDGGIMAVPQMIGQEGAQILYSGSRAAFDRYEDTFTPMAAARFVGEDPGLAALLDLAMLTGMYGQIAGALQAMAMIGAEGDPVAGFTEDLLVPWLTAMAGLLPRWAASIDERSWVTDVSNLEVNSNGLAALERATREQGLTGDLLAPLRRIVDARTARGHGDHGLPSLIEELHPDLHRS
ncbi:NAD(P)-binding domain-containing protein [Nonomuraea sp. NBC_01738]|uniref:NAD(P)-dependent oxidoreductase n=1 Tax=Nonomuraea sp. NBC_01738 TaxID=2976003 RepID=UPI002E10A313|nr:NAD(P)-binding domain-containing protein [Nonomuraea sp. NBC_01738]